MALSDMVPRKDTSLSEASAVLIRNGYSIVPAADNPEGSMKTEAGHPITVFEHPKFGRIGVATGPQGMEIYKEPAPEKLTKPVIIPSRGEFNPQAFSAAFVNRLVAENLLPKDTRLVQAEPKEKTATPR